MRVIRKTLVILLSAATLAALAVYVTSFYRRIYYDHVPKKHILLVVEARSGYGAVVAISWPASGHYSGRAKTQLPMFKEQMRDDPNATDPSYFRRHSNAPGLSSFLGFGYGKSAAPYYSWITRQVFMFPLWFPVVVFAAYPLLLLWRRPIRGWRRRRRGLCAECAYDLTGNLSGVCPECGTAISKGASAD
ncbi:MAG: hypothetical protein JSU63_13480 [Phycisphaerales bacterium]|nr:MAG: hypothetical protein JSU63_13480 [Phycisphaerales bacterium]